MTMFGMRQRVADGAGEHGAVVAHDQLAPHFHAQRVQLIRDEQRVGVQSLRGQHLRAHGDDLGIACSGVGMGGSLVSRAAFDAQR